MEELRKCPFCGGEAHVHEHIFHKLPSTFGIECDVCGAMTNGFYSYRVDAIAAWNRRTTQNIGKKECSVQEGRCTFDE